MLLRKQSIRSLVKYEVHHNLAERHEIKVWLCVGGVAVPYWKASLELFEAFVSIDFVFCIRSSQKSTKFSKESQEKG